MSPLCDRWSRAVLGAVALALFLVGGVAAAEVDQFTGRVVAVTDGDTIGVLRDGREVPVRLEGIDCPETGQDFGKRAKQFTSELVFGRTVSVDVRDIDRYGRLVARVTIQGGDTSLALLQAGLAWHYKQYSRDPLLAQAEQEARAKRVGLWIQPNAVPPWTFRTPRTSSQAPAPQKGGRAGLYHGNSESKVLHAPGCQHYACRHCTVTFESISQAEAAGYRKHGGSSGCFR